MPGAARRRAGGGPSTPSFPITIILHSLVLSGCDAPPTTDPVWECRGHAVCGGNNPATQHVLYGWAKDAPPMVLPDGAGFRLGGGAGTRSLVLQVHYTQRRPPGDASGVRLALTADPVPFAAGLTMFALFFSLPPKTPAVRVPNACCLRGFEPAHAFAFRVHTHDLGQEVYLETGLPKRFRGGAGGGDAPLARVAGRSPQLPQGFTPLATPLTVWPGDRLTVTCVFNTTGVAHTVHAGATHADEMCNLYLMAWGALPAFGTCVDAGPGVTDRRGPGGVGLGLTAVPEPAAVFPPGLREGPGGPPPRSGPPPIGGGADGRPAGGGAADGAAVSSAAAGDAAAPRGLGQATGVAWAGNGTLLVLHRAGRPWGGGSFDRFTHAFRAGDGGPPPGPIPDSTLVRVDADSGAVLGATGAGLFLMPHMVTPLVREGAGRAWVADTGAHAVHLLSPDGTRIERTLGTPGVSGSGPAHFCKPTHVAVGGGGDIYVGDGYCGARVARFGPDGRHLRDYDLAAAGGATAGGPSNAPIVVHAIALDECAGILVAADRERKAVRGFDLATGNPTGSWDLSRHGQVYALAPGPYGSFIALAWDRDAPGSPARAVLLADNPPTPPPAMVRKGGEGAPQPDGAEEVWDLPGADAPHDLAVLAAPARYGGGDRPLALVIGETHGDGTGAVRKYILVSGAGVAEVEKGGGGGEGGGGQATPAVDAWAAMHASAAAVRASAAAALAAEAAAGPKAVPPGGHAGHGGGPPPPAERKENEEEVAADDPHAGHDHHDHAAGPGIDSGSGDDDGKDEENDAASPAAPGLLAAKLASARSAAAAWAAAADSRAAAAMPESAPAPHTLAAGAVCVGGVAFLWWRRRQAAAAASMATRRFED